MGLEIAGFALAGCVLGIFTGLFPGLHVNTVALLALSIPGLDGIGLMVLIASMATVHTFVDFVPSIVFGAPSTETFLSVLPGHRLLMEGKGLVAVRLTIAGGLFAGLGAMALAPVFVLFVEKGAGFLSTIMPFALALIIAAMAFGEKGLKKTGWATIVISFSGILGLLALRASLPLKQPLFCLATGFFGASILIESILKRPVVAKQVTGGFFIEKAKIAKNSVLALFGGSLVSLMPGIGASQAAFIVRNLVGKIKASDYLIILGGVNTANAVLSFFVLFAWQKTRTGAAAAISQLGSFGMQELLLVSMACILGLGFGAIATNAVAGKAIRLVNAIDYRKVNGIILASVTGLVFVFSGALGIAFYLVAASIGILAINSKVKRSNCMAFLIVPTIASYAAFV